MNTVLRSTILPLYRIWCSWVNDDRKFRLARRQSRASGWTARGYTIRFRRQDYAQILKACRIRKQSASSFLEEAALERAHFTLHLESSGRLQ